MSSKEYFLVLPLLLYGLAVADLVTSWKINLESSRRYGPYVVTSLLLLEGAFWNFYRMYHWAAEEHFESYFAYFRILAAPMIFLVVVALFIPDKEVDDIQAHFIKRMPVIFGGLALFVASHFLVESDAMVVTRIIFITLLVITAALRKPWLVYFLVLVRIGALVVTTLRNP